MKPLFAPGARPDYSTTRRGAEAALGSDRDLTRSNGRHRDAQLWWSLFDAKALQFEAGGGGGDRNLRGFGAPVALSL